MTPRYRRLIKSMDKEIDPESQEGAAAAMLMCSLKMVSRGSKVDVGRILNATGVPSTLGFRIAERLRKNRIWWWGKLRHSGWDDEQTGQIAFWMDVSIGVGYLNRASASKTGAKL